MAVILPQVVLLILLTSSFVTSLTENQEVENEIHEFLELKPGYNLHQYPKNHYGLPVTVNFSVNVRSIFSLNEKEEILSTEMSIRMYWKESRLRLNLPDDYPRNYITLHPKVAESFWIPDVFIDRAKTVRVPTYHTKPTSLRIYNDSTMRYSRLFLHIQGSIKIIFHFLEKDAAYNSKKDNIVIFKLVKITARIDYWLLFHYQNISRGLLANSQFWQLFFADEKVA